MRFFHIDPAANQQGQAESRRRHRLGSYIRLRLSALWYVRSALYSLNHNPGKVFRLLSLACVKVQMKFGHPVLQVSHHRAVRSEHKILRLSEVPFHNSDKTIPIPPLKSLSFAT